ncbi:MAG: esterase-like activity of phytase family protein, partial [Burkholderiaceae bacterium]
MTRGPWRAPRGAARALALALLVQLAGCTLPPSPRPPVPAQARQLRLIGATALPPGTEFLGSTVGGISGIDYDPAQDRYLLISDDRSVHQPARAYTARLRYSDRLLAPPELTGVITLRHESGQP